MPVASLDGAWKTALNVANATNIDYGSELIFNFGPYASVYTREYYPSIFVLTITSSLFFSLCYGLIVSEDMKDCPIYLQVILILLLLVLGYDALFQMYPFFWGLWVYLSIRNSGILSKAWINQAVIFTSGLSLVSLIKGTVFIESLFIVICSLFLVILSGQKRRLNCVAFILFFYIAGLLFFWWLSGQDIHNFPIFVARLFSLSSGYSEAMAIYSSHVWQPIVYVLLAIAICLFIGFFSEKRYVIFLLVIVSGTLFLNFKHGFVRHDGHALVAAQWVVFLSIIMFLLYKFCYKGVICQVLIFIASSVYLGFLSFQQHGVVPNPILKLNSIYVDVLSIGSNSDLERNFYNRMEKIRSENPFPHLPGTSDLYNCDQSYLFASDNRWNPRPVIQSYQACTRQSIQWNLSHLTDKDRPDNIFLNLHTIDHRYPTLDDGVSLLEILDSYELKDNRGGFLILQSAPARNLFLKQSYSVRRIKFSQDVSLTEYDEGILFIKLNFKKTLVGKVANLLFKVPPLYITVITKDGKKKYRLISSMTETGFILSPLLLTSSDFGFLSEGFIKENKLVTSFKIEAPYAKWFWNKNIEMELNLYEKKASNLQGYDPIWEKFKLSKVSSLSEELMVNSNSLGHIDSVNIESFLQDESKRVLTIRGWVYPKNPDHALFDPIVVLENVSTTQRYVVKAKKKSRLDVSRYFKNHKMRMSGVDEAIDVSNLRGVFKVNMGYAVDGEYLLNSKLTKTIKIE